MISLVVENNKILDLQFSWQWLTGLFSEVIFPWVTEWSPKSEYTNGQETMARKYKNSAAQSAGTSSAASQAYSLLHLA